MNEFKYSTVRVPFKKKGVAIGFRPSAKGNSDHLHFGFLSKDSGRDFFLEKNSLGSWRVTCRNVFLDLSL